MKCFGESPVAGYAGSGGGTVVPTAGTSRSTEAKASTTNLALYEIK